MPKLEAAIAAFHQLGNYLRSRAAGQTANNVPGEDPSFSGMLARAEAQNAWFTPEEVLFALGIWAEQLSEDKLRQWLEPYPEAPTQSGTVALIAAGNIPLVGFHDLLSVLLSGHRALVRCASNDRVLLPFLAERLVEFAPELQQRICFIDETLEDYDAVIATGSNNTSRYFEYYFGQKPHIIRKNRNSIAIVTGEESPQQLNGLAEDVFRYFGMGCRSVSKIFVPEGYDFDPLFEAFYAYRDRIHHPKYANNYDYNKAVFLMSGAPMLDNGFLLIKQDAGLASPIGTLFYETYTGLDALQAQLQASRDQLQCVVGPAHLPQSIPYGQTQKPGLSDYADGVDTLSFLLKASVK